MHFREPKNKERARWVWGGWGKGGIHPGNNQTSDLSLEHLAIPHNFKDPPYTMRHVDNKQSGCLLMYHREEEKATAHTQKKGSLERGT